MADNPYEVLGVAPDASQDEIRKAYRKLAKQFHPDLNPGNAAAADRFKAVASAYDIVGDPDKRGRFDRGEIDASGDERPQHQYYRDFADQGAGHHYASSAGYDDLGDMSDFFSDIFGRRAQAGGGAGGGRVRMPGPDVRYHLEIDFLEAVSGATKRVTMPDGKTLDIAVPEGLRDGQTIRLKGQGGPGFGGGPAGDAYVEISVRPHPQFERQGDDIVLTLPISLDEAVLGARVEVPTTTGRVTMTVPKGASGGQTLRLRGKGIKRRQGGGHGDQLVRLQVRLPETIDDELAAFMERWREGHGYNPRKSMEAGR
ncbi:J domain-containing protein [Amorphus orientalis]|uniref:DnaJ-class molecular chaperone n=1 Tax=Amorphus orientalis TaxID=649198 RepID=A0AAE3VKX1_9HYPH|nr:J domain-containing protein [Amorphus orientalis]MDQ0313596.1 DnaJ-class molecular chaperone [Amorphus orientalis]